MARQVRIAVLWDDEVPREGDGPFTEDYLRAAYEAFSAMAADRDARVYIAHWRDYRDGRLETAWVHEDRGWRQVSDVMVDVVFDKYRFDADTVPVKQTIMDRHPVLNDLELERICKDKLLTGRTFPEHVPETREADEEVVAAWLDQDGRVVLKPRYAFGGEGVRVIDDISSFEAAEDLLVQRFVDTTQGVPGLDIDGVHDLRVYVFSGAPRLAYVRTPDDGFISNVAQGGSITFVDLDQVPEAAMAVVEAVAERFDRFNPSFYAVDLAIDPDGRAWILECNSKPGLAFYGDEEIEERKRPVMEQVVDALVMRGQERHAQ